MPIPEVIEIVPLDKPVRAEISVPGSKSITNRALILAALAEGETILEGALWSEDTQVMVRALRGLGFNVNVEADPQEPCNRSIAVKGLGGCIPNAGTEEMPLHLFVGNAGTAARFLSAFVCLGDGAYRLYGVPRMHERPQDELFSAIRRLGFEIESENRNDKLPARIAGGGPVLGIEPHFDVASGRFVGRGVRNCKVSIEKSSQFASALLLCARAGRWNVEVVGQDAEESPYVALTHGLISAFPNKGGRFRIEADASSGSYFLGASALIQPPISNPAGQLGQPISSEPPPIIVACWPVSDWQIDQQFPKMLYHAASQHEQIVQQIPQEPVPPPPGLHRGRTVSRLWDLGDSIMTAIVMAPLWPEEVRFTDLGRMRLQECERVVALRTELTKCGAKVIEEGDTLTVYPSALHGAEIETYDDHRMAMCFAILGLKVPGIKLRNPACVKKTFPNFFQKLVAPPPDGLGARILDATTRRQLAFDELYAE